MRSPPRDVSTGRVLAALRQGWGLRGSARYVPLGAGSHHWALDDDSGRAWFVTVDDLGPDGDPAALERALQTALALRRDAGLAFVVAPVPTLAGTALRRLGSRYAVSVFPFVPGVAGSFGAHAPQDREEVVRLLVELHRATPAVVATAPRADLTLPGRDELEAALRELDRTWTGGPFAEPARALLAGQAPRLRGRLEEFDRLVAEVRASGDGAWVVTHGEPHPGNVIRGVGGLHLVDWDTVQVAPPERDLWMVAPSGAELLAGYTGATGRPVSAAALALYPLWWELADIAIYVGEFRRPHRATDNLAASWTYLTSYVE